MAGIYGKSGDEYWDRQIKSALSGLRNSRSNTVNVPNQGSGRAEVSPTAIDWSKFNFGSNPEPQEEEKNFLQKAVEAPVIKQVLDAVSVFNYAGANIADNMVESAEQGKGPLNYVGDVFQGIGEGVSGAFGNEDNAKSYGDVIRRVQKNMGVDTESAGAKAVSGIGGFAGDVLLDPTTYVGVGAIKGVAGGIKNTAKLRSAEKVNKALEASGEAENVIAPLRKTVPGNYTPEFRNELIRAKRSDFTPAEGSLSFDAVRPSRKAAQIEEVKLDFQAKNPNKQIREAASGKIEAFKAGFDESMQKFRLQERSRKLSRIENKAARRMMRANPEQAVVDLIKIPYENLTQTVLYGSESTANRLAESIVKTHDDVMGVERTTTEIKAVSADMVDTIKMDIAEGVIPSAPSTLDSLWGKRGARQVLHKGGKPKQFTPKESKQIIERAVAERKNARAVNAAARRAERAGLNSKDADNKFWEEAANPIPEGASANVVTDGIKAVENPEAQKVDNVIADESPVANDPWGNPAKPVEDSVKPGAITPEEIKHVSEEITDTFDDLISKPGIYQGMKARSVEEVQAVEAAFVFAKAKLPNGNTALGKSNFFYPKSVIEKANKLNNAVASDEQILAAYKAVATPQEFAKAKEIFAGSKIRRNSLRRDYPKFAEVEARVKAGAADKLYINLGIHPKDVEFARSGELSSTSISEYERNTNTIIKHLRNLTNDPRSSAKYRMSEEHPLWETFDELKDIFGVETPQQVATALNNAKKSPLWRESMRYATGARITKKDLQGLTESVGDDVIRASLTLVPTEETAAAIAKNVEESSREIVEFYPQLIEQIDNRILSGAKYQRTPQGKRRTDRTGASTEGDGFGAIINQHWNTHSNIKALGSIHSLLKGYNKQNMFKSLEEQDRITMAVFRYYDNTLRQAGIDTHLTNMAEPYTRKVTRMLEDGDSVTETITTGQYAVRLGISDVMEAMTPDLRMQYLYGDIDLNITQFLDMGEAMVRGARELDPLTGMVDYERAKLLTKLALTGERGNFRLFDRDGNTRLLTVKDNLSELVKSGNRIMAREVHHNLDNLSQVKILENAVRNKLVDLKGEKLLSKTEIDEAFKVINEDGVKVLRPADDIARRLAVLLDGKNLDGDSLVSDAVSQIKNTLYDDIIESFFNEASDGRKPFNKLVERSIENSMKAGKRITEDVTEISAANYDRLMEVIDSGSNAKMIEEIATEAAVVNRIAPEAQHIVKTNRAADIERVIPEKTVDSLKAQASVASKVTPENANSVRKELVSTPDVTPEVINKIDPKTPEDATAIMEVLYDVSVAQLSLDFANKMGRKFNPSQGMEHSYDIITKSNHSISGLMDSMTRQFRAWEKNGITSKNLATSLNKIRQYVKNDVPLSKLSGVDRQVADFFDLMFNTSKYNFFKANGIEGAAMNRFKHNLQKSFDTDTAKLLGRENEDIDISKLWTQLPIKDPYSFSSKLFYVYAKTAQETMIAADFSKRFGVKLSPERAKELGYFKITDSGDKNIFARMIDNELYYPKEIADEIPFINRMMNENRGFSGELQNFMENVWDPVVSVLKMGQTSIKPGHHVMSIVGDWWRNLMLTGSTMTREYKQAAHLVGALRKARKNEMPMDALGRKLESFVDYEFKSISTKSNNEEYLTLMLGQGGGRKVATKVSVQELLNLGENHGVFFAPHSGGVTEDLLSGASAGVKGEGFAKGVKTISDKLLDNRMTAAINAFSADRDGLMRGALFLHYLQSKKFKSLEDAAIYAGAQVRKAAPVAADLTAWESKYMRRGVFYYTWLRGITPRILETLLTRPGLAMIPSKGMYELAAANGLDPNSFGDPMSEEIKSTLPDYYTERVMGPAWQDAKTGEYWGFSTVSPTIDVLNSFGSNVALKDLVPNPYSTEESAYQKLGETFIGMVTPWVKYPVELATGRRMDNGAPIESNVQYLQDQNAIARTISKFTGKNIDGLNRTETRYRNGMGDRQQEIQGTELANFLGSLQLTNYSADNITKAAEFQEKDAQTQQKKLEQRMGLGE